MMVVAPRQANFRLPCRTPIKGWSPKLKPSIATRLGGASRRRGGSQCSWRVYRLRCWCDPETAKSREDSSNRLHGKPESRTFRRSMRRHPRVRRRSSCSNSLQSTAMHCPACRIARMDWTGSFRPEPSVCGPTSRRIRGNWRYSDHPGITAPPARSPRSGARRILPLCLTGQPVRPPPSIGAAPRSAAIHPGDIGLRVLPAHADNRIAVGLGRILSSAASSSCAFFILVVREERAASTR